MMFPRKTKKLKKERKNEKVDVDNEEKVQMESGSTALKDESRNKKENSGDFDSKGLINSSSDQEARSYITPRDNDVILGRGRTAFVHEGNRKLRQLVTDNAQLFSKAKTRLEKTSVVKGIMKQVEGKGGLFLKKDQSSSRYYAADYKSAREKVGHALRDACAGKVKCLRGILSSFQDSNMPSSKRRASPVKSREIATQNSVSQASSGQRDGKFSPKNRSIAVATAVDPSALKDSCSNKGQRKRRSRRPSIRNDDEPTATRRWSGGGQWELSTPPHPEVSISATPESPTAMAMQVTEIVDRPSFEDDNANNSNLFLVENIHDTLPPPPLPLAPTKRERRFSASSDCSIKARFPKSVSSASSYCSDILDMYNDMSWEHLEFSDEINNNRIDSGGAGGSLLSTGQQEQQHMMHRFSRRPTSAHTGATIPSALIPSAPSIDHLLYEAIQIGKSEDGNKEGI